MLANRTPPWEAICFTQTGQRSGELAANYDQISAQESLDAEVCVSSYFAAAKGRPLIVCLEAYRLPRWLFSGCVLVSCESNPWF